MKKLAVIFAVLAMLFFVSCGDSKNDDKTDTGDSGDTVSDTGDTEPDGDTGADTGDTEPDGDSGADTGDSDPDGDTGADTGDSDPDGDSGADTGDPEPDGDSGADTGDPEPDDDDLVTAYKKADDHAKQVTAKSVQANNSLGMKIFSKVAAGEPGKNAMISPLSISIAMAMSTNGASGENLDEMKEVLGFGDMALPDVNEQFKHLIASLVAADKDLVLSIANSVWMREDFSLDVKTAFTDVLNEFYDAEIFAEGFNIENINAWVSEKTNGKIDKIVEEIGEDIVMYLINAIYFKAAWTTAFNEENTHSGTFTLSDGTETQADYMSFSEAEEVPAFLAYSSDYGDEDGFSMIRIPYGRGVFAFYGIVPNYGNKSKIDDFIAKIAENGFEHYYSFITPMSDFPLLLPKFKFEYEKSLVGIFKELGMEKAFKPGGPFHNIAEEPHDPIISEIKHKTFIEVNEAGTEAAAVTSVEYSDGAIPGGFFADRPFVFVIRDDRTGSILFIGKVENPKAE